MSERFDPYHKWLGIPPSEQPPNHYRLLAINLFESDLEVISNAAYQRMAHVRTFQIGKHSEISQTLLNEIAAAKVCLLDPEKKAAYDRQLRDTLAARQSADSRSRAETDALSDGPASEGLENLLQKAGINESVAAPTWQSPGRKAKSAGRLWLILGGAGVAAVVVSVGVLSFLPSKPGIQSQRAGDPASDGNRRGERYSRDPGERQPPKKESEKPQSPDTTPPLPDNAPKKTDEPGPRKDDEEPRASDRTDPAAPKLAKPRRKPTKSGVADGPRGGRPLQPKRQPAEKYAIPSVEIQQKVGDTVEEAYKLAQAKTPEEKLKLAKSLSEVAKRTTTPDEQYVLLVKATELACDGGDAGLMLEMCDALGRAFVIEPLTAKVAMLERFTKGPRNPARIQSLVEGSDRVIQEAKAQDQYDAAVRLAKSVADACGRSSPKLRIEAADRRKGVEKLQKQWEEVQTAQGTLKDQPDDPAANLVVGLWFWLVKDDWKKGLPYLAKGSDEELKALVQRELASATGSPEDRVTLADAWWDVAASRRGDEKKAFLRRAGQWYEQAMPGLIGLSKTKVESRLAEIAKMSQESALQSGRRPPLAIAPFDQKTARRHQLSWAKYLGVPVEIINSVGMRLVLIPPGEFMMGSEQQMVGRLITMAEQRKMEQWYILFLRSEAPRHRVTLTRPFYLGVCEVTQAEYEKVAGHNPSYYKESGRNAPVDSVCWTDAVAFCKLLSALPEERSGGSYRLPTEAEWEYAARAGTTTSWCFGDDASAISRYAWWQGNSSGLRTHSVGQKTSNAFGIFDTHGNVAEWCADWCQPDYYGQSPGVDPSGPSIGTTRVVRGGSSVFLDQPEDLRCAWRGQKEPSRRENQFGFRVARAVER
jgi:formylglycine-generating enzyme required for sulfatase activity